MKRLKQLITLFALFAGLAVGLSMSGSHLTQGAEPAPKVAPTPKVPVSPNGITRTGAFGSKYVDRNGIYPANGATGQPTDKPATSVGKDKPIMSIPHLIHVTYLKGDPSALPPRNSQKVIKIQAAEYTGTEWSDWRDGLAQEAQKYKEPDMDLNIEFPVSTNPGVHYVQLKITFDHKGPFDATPDDVYSEVFAVTMTPYGASEVAVNPDPQLVLWGQPAPVQAVLTPAQANPPVTWTTPSDAPGTLTQTTGIETTFQSTVLTDATDSRLKTPNGTTTTVTATAHNSAVFEKTGTGNITLGGVTPIAVERGEPLRFGPDGLADTIPANATYQWVIYDASYNAYTPKPNENAVLDARDFQWNNVQANGANAMFYQLQVTVPGDGTAPQTWYSNIAPITITDNPLAPTLITVPNLSFANGDGTNPTIADFYDSPVTMLEYQKPQDRARATYDGNNNGQLIVKSRQTGWSLSVAFAPFVNQKTGKPLMGSTQEPSILLNFAGTGQTTAPVNNSPSLVADVKATDPDTSLNTTLTSGMLMVRQTKQIEVGTYDSTATWTLTQAP